VDQRLGLALEDRHPRLATGLNVQPELRPQVEDGRIRRGDHEPAGLRRDPSPEPAPAAEDAIDRDQVQVRRTFDREHHAVEHRQRGAPGAEPQAARCEEVALGGVRFLPEFPLDSVELDHDGEAAGDIDPGVRPRGNRSLVARPPRRKQKGEREPDNDGGGRARQRQCQTQPVLALIQGPGRGTPTSTRAASGRSARILIFLNADDR
jgi:hypothetical protein